MSALGTLMVMMIMILMDVDIVGRFFFNKPMRGVPEIVTVSLAIIVFLQFPATLRAGRVIMVDGFLEWLSPRCPRCLMCLQAFYHLAGTIMFLILFKAIYPLFLSTLNSGDYYGVAQVFTIKKWPIQAFVLFGCFVMMVQYFIMFIDFTKAALHGEVLEPLGDPADRILS